MIGRANIAGDLRTLAFFASGYNNRGLANTGRSVYALDALTGAHLARWDFEEIEASGSNDDMTGTEYGGTLKNVIAIAAGILDGLELGTNAKSALMVRGQVENMRFALRFGAKPETLWGLAGMGDLITTCSSVMSRNYHVGSNLAKGKTLKEILADMTAVAEGVETSKLIHEIAQREGLDMPVTAQVHAVLFEDKPVREALAYLMSRELKAEH